MSLRVLNRACIEKLCTPQRALSWIEQAMREWSAGRMQVPLRSKMAISDGELLLMPAAMPGAYASKIISLHPDNPAQGQPAVQGGVLLFDADSGAPQALLDAASITALRTAAASALASRELARPTAKSLGLLGTGEQAFSHALAICQVRDITQLFVWGRDFRKAQALQARLQPQLPDVDVLPVSEVGPASACDIVCTVTASAQPVLLSDFVQAGAHINLVGAHHADCREADSALMARAAIYVDTQAGAEKEAGDILIPHAEGRIAPEQQRGELGSVLLGDAPGRQGDDEITVYKSLGFAGQDLCFAQALYALACAQGLGQEVSF